MGHVNTDLNDIARARHIVGWCSEARFFAGAPGMNYAIKPSQLRRPGREFSMEKFTTTFSLGEVISGGCTFSVGNKDTHVRITRSSYKARLEWLDQKYVTLWDVDENRGWLVNGSAALLHLLRTSLESSKVDKFKSEFLFDPSKFEESPNPFTFGSTLDVLLNPVNQKLELYTKDEHTYTETKIMPNGQQETVVRTVSTRTTIKDRTEELYETLEKLIDYNARKEGSNKGINLNPSRHNQLEGWDFADIATDRDPFYLKKASLPLHMLSWVDFTRAIPAITLFGRGFGDMVRASPVRSVADSGAASASSSPHSSCLEWTTVPKDRYLLCVSVADLRAIIDRVGDEQTNPVTLAPGIVWCNPHFGSPFHANCACSSSTKDTKGKRRQKPTAHHSIQELAFSRNRATRTLPLVDLVTYPRGALIFGSKQQNFPLIDSAASPFGTMTGNSSGTLEDSLGDASSDTPPTSVASAGCPGQPRNGGDSVVSSSSGRRSGRSSDLQLSSRSDWIAGPEGSSPSGPSIQHSSPPPPPPIAGVKRRVSFGERVDSGDALDDRRGRELMPIHKVAKMVEKTFRRHGNR